MLALFSADDGSLGSEAFDLDFQFWYLRHDTLLGLAGQGSVRRLPFSVAQIVYAPLHTTITRLVNSSLSHMALRAGIEPATCCFRGSRLAIRPPEHALLTLT